MKKTFILNTLVVFCFCVINLKAQDCSSYFSFQKGMKIEMTSYDKKDKVSVLLKYEILDYKNTGNAMTLTIKNETYDAKGKLIVKGESSGTCKNGEYFADLRNIATDMIPKTADLQMEYSGDQLVYPANLKEGQQLKDASVTMKASMAGGMTLMNVTANILDRKVAGFETIETPAGKFECAKITYTMKVKFMGNRTLSCSEYLAKGIGVVKSEQFDDKGKKQTTMMLTKLEK